MPYAFHYSRFSRRKSPLNPAALSRYHQLVKQGGYKAGGRYRDALDMADTKWCERRAGKKLFWRMERGDALVIDNPATTFTEKLEMARRLTSWQLAGIIVHIDTIGLHTDTAEGRMMVRGISALFSIKQFDKEKKTPLNRRSSQIAFGWRDMKRTIPNEEERAFAVKVWELKKTMTFDQMEAMMREKGFRTLRTGTPMRFDYLSRIYQKALKMAAAGEITLPTVSTEPPLAPELPTSFAIATPSTPAE